jgi:hypothetical protein
LFSLTSIQLEFKLQVLEEEVEPIKNCASRRRMLMNQDRDNKWRQLCQAAAAEQDSKRLMELVAELNKELDNRDRKPKFALVNRHREEGSFGIDLALE